MGDITISRSIPASVVALTALAALLVLTFLPAPAGAALPRLSVHNARATEGEDAIFRVTLSRPAKRGVRFLFETRRGIATRKDFEPRHDRVWIAAGKTERRIRIHTIEDSLIEFAESFYMRVKSLRPNVARDGRENASGRILDDDGGT